MTNKKKEKELAKDLLNGYKSFNSPKIFSSKIFQNYLVFIPAKKYIKYFTGTTRSSSWKFFLFRNVSKLFSIYTS